MDKHPLCFDQEIKRKGEYIGVWNPNAPLADTPTVARYCLTCAYEPDWIEGRPGDSDTYGYCKFPIPEKMPPFISGHGERIYQYSNTQCRYEPDSYDGESGYIGHDSCDCYEPNKEKVSALEAWAEKEKAATE